MDALKQSVEKLKQGKEEAEPPPILAPSKKGANAAAKEKVIVNPSPSVKRGFRLPSPGAGL